MNLGGFALHHQFVTATSLEPSRWVCVVHGILGSGANWRTFARSVVARRPEWGVVLADLREHGRSLGAPPPHTIARAAEDVHALLSVLAITGKPVGVVLGHSLGGKVALAHRKLSGAGLAQTWVVDSSPSAQPPAVTEALGTAEVLRAVSALPREFPSRDTFVQSMTSQGFSLAIAHWLAMNLEPVGDHMRMRIDLDNIRALLEDYYAQDLWDAVEDPALPGELYAVIAGQSQAVSDEDRRRFDAAAQANPKVSAFTIPQAGHWVHVDALEPLVELVSSSLPE